MPTASAYLYKYRRLPWLAFLSKTTPILWYRIIIHLPSLILHRYMISLLKIAQQYMYYNVMCRHFGRCDNSNDDLNSPQCLTYISHLHIPMVIMSYRSSMSCHQSFDRTTHPSSSSSGKYQYINDSSARRVRDGLDAAPCLNGRSQQQHRQGRTWGIAIDASWLSRITLHFGQPARIAGITAKFPEHDVAKNHCFA